MKKVLSTLLLVFITVAAMAVPAKKGLWKTITLENGQEVKALLKGDEFGHYWHATDGKRYVAVEGQYREETPEMRQMAASRRVQAQQRRMARLPKKAANGVRRASEAHLNQKKGLILLVNFKDVKFQEENNQAFYNNVANTPDYTDENGFQGSVADYFKDQSRGKFELTFDVVGPVTVSKNAKYYGENDANGEDKHPEEMVVEAVKLAKDQVTNWNQYDWDGNGEVDQVMIIYAGEGEADGGAESTIWPHEWQLQYVNLDFEVVDGLKINTYAVANEGSVQQDYWTGIEYFAVNGIGTICHEFSHCLGLPDMYDTGYGGYYGMGAWSLMDSGSYNGDGFIPSGYTSYDKYCIGWIEPTELTTATEVNDMHAVNESDDVYIIKNAAHPDEYYLIESRQKKGWDAETPAKGMLILHVDYDPDIWFYNLVNSNSDGSYGYPVNDHQRCTIFHADGVDKTGEIYDKINDIIEKMENASGSAYDKLEDQYYDLWDQYDADVKGDVYPQEGNKQLTNTSKPRAFLYNKNSDGRKLMNISITDITQNANGTMAFKFAPDNSGTEEGDNTVYGYSTTTKPDVEGALFYESFDMCDGKGGNDGMWSGQIATGQFNTDNEGWTAEKGYGANECAKFGTSSIAGSATTPAFAMNGTGVLTFRAGAWNAKNDETTLNVSVSNGTISVTSVEMEKGNFTDYEATITATGNVKITFESAKGRFFLDEVLVKESTTTAIRTVDTTANQTTRIYSLDGRYAGSDCQLLRRGIYIVNGRKVVIK